MDVACNFTHAHYAEICQSIVDRGYRPIHYSEDGTTAKEERVIILRHDVDQSLEAALQLAQIEHSMGVKSTFFLWLTSPFYNVFDPSQSGIIRRLLSLGHQIGLHFDEHPYSIETPLDLSAAVKREAQILSAFFEVDIQAVSMHRPSKVVLENDIELGGLINAYGRRFFKEYKYLSDSRRQWREGCVCSKISDQQYQRLHLLTHAFWWTAQPVPDVDSRVREFLGSKLQYLDREAANNISVYHGLSERRGSDEAEV